MIGIVVCCCYKYLKDYYRSFDYWKNNISKYSMFKLFFVFGNITSYYDEPNYDVKKCILTIDQGDAYEDLPIKIVSAFEYIYKKYPEINYIFKTDDDIKINDFDLFVEDINKFTLARNDYGGMYHHVTNGGTLSEYRKEKFTSDGSNKNMNYDKSSYCYGGGYILSVRAVSILSQNKSYFEKQCLEDVAVGHILNKHNIEPVLFESKFIELARL